MYILFYHSLTPKGRDNGRLTIDQANELLEIHEAFCLSGALHGQTMVHQKRASTESTPTRIISSMAEVLNTMKHVRAGKHKNMYLFLSLFA